MKSTRIIKLQAAYLTGCFNQNVFESYLPFFVKAVEACNLVMFNAEEVSVAICSRYGVDLPLTFVRTVLAVGCQRELFCNDKKSGRYYLVQAKAGGFVFDDREFNAKWARLKAHFMDFCVKRKQTLPEDVEEELLRCIEEVDAIDEDDDGALNPSAPNGMDFLWRSFVVELHDSNQEGFDYVSALSLCTVIKDAEFFDGDARHKFSGLKVYLDTPILFGLLGFSEQPRVSLCRHLASQLNSAGCQLLVFDQCYQELERNLTDANYWAHEQSYDASKASPAARVIFESRITYEEMVSRIENVEEELKGLGVRVQRTEYDVSEDKFQECERTLQQMLEERYRNQGRIISEQRLRGIAVDIRSIVFASRYRRGYRPTHLYDARHLLVTLNSAVAGVAYDYMRKNEGRQDVIPACVSADVLGSALWLFSPVELAGYHRLRFLADCYAATNPSRALLESYSDTLRKVREKGMITEEQFIRCRASSVIRRPLAACVSGNSEAFTEKTCLELVEEMEDRERFRIAEAVRMEREQAKKEKDIELESKDKEIAELRIKSKEELCAKDKELGDEKVKSLENAQKAEELDKLVASTARQKEKLIRTVAVYVTWVMLGIPAFGISALMVPHVKLLSEVMEKFCVSPFWCGGILGVALAIIVGWKTPCLKVVSDFLEKHINRWLERNC